MHHGVQRSLSAARSAGGGSCGRSEDPRPVTVFTIRESSALSPRGAPQGAELPPPAEMVRRYWVLRAGGVRRHQAIASGLLWLAQGRIRPANEPRRGLRARRTPAAHGDL